MSKVIEFVGAHPILSGWVAGSATLAIGIGLASGSVGWAVIVLGIGIMIGAVALGCTQLE